MAIDYGNRPFKVVFLSWLTRFVFAEFLSSAPGNPVISQVSDGLRPSFGSADGS